MTRHAPRVLHDERQYRGFESLRVLQKFLELHCLPSSLNWKRASSFYLEVCGFKSCRGLQKYFDLEAQMEGRDRAKVEDAGSSPAGITRSNVWVRSLTGRADGSYPSRRRFKSF